MAITLRISRRDWIILGAFLAIAAAIGGAAQFDIARKRAALEREAQAQKEAFFADLDASQSEVLVEVESGKMLGFFGKDFGVVRLYSRATGDAAMESFLGIEYFYRFVDGAWTTDDTAQIKEPERIYEGYTAFRNAGYEVDDAAYTRYDR